MASLHDIPLLVKSANAASERRVSPAWTIAQLKTRLEPITGIPASVQRLQFGSVAVEAADEDATYLSGFGLQPYAELQVIDTRPVSMQQNFTDLSSVEKYVMPETEYEQRTDSVLAWKKTQKLGRFDPNAPTIEQQKVKVVEREVEERGIRVNLRCRLLPESDSRRGAVAYVGPVPEIPGGPPSAPWVGVLLDEPVGKNDGSVAGKKYFDVPSGGKRGVFVRPDRVEVGDFKPELDDELEDDDMEEM